MVSMSSPEFSSTPVLLPLPLAHPVTDTWLLDKHRWCPSGDVRLGSSGVKALPHVREQGEDKVGLLRPPVSNRFSSRTAAAGDTEDRDRRKVWGL